MTDFPRIEHDVKLIGLDYETTGLNYWHPDFRVFGVAIATADSEWYWDLRDHPGLIPYLKDLMKGREIAAHNAQYEVQCSRVLGIDPRQSKWWCTMVNECLIDEHQMTYDLESVARRNLVDSDKSSLIEQMIQATGAKNKDALFSDLEQARRTCPELLAIYGAGDARMTYDIYNKQMAEVQKQDLWGVVNMEQELLPVLADMSWHGVRVDLDAAHAAIPKLDSQIEIIQSEVETITGGTFNVNSTPQIRAFFKPEPLNKFQYRLIDGTVVGTTKGGKGPSIGQDALREIKHPLAEKILALRKSIKLRDTFIRGHVIGSADGDGYVHTSFNQTRNDADAGTITGRLSSTGPALQQITKRDKINAAILRAMFLADADQQWLCMDYSQVDFRCGAHLQNDPNVIAAYLENPKMDYHRIVSDMTGIPRNPTYAGAPNTKQINLGLSFGAGAGKLAFMMHMPYEVRDIRGRIAYLPGAEARRIFELYHSKLPAVKKFMERAENVAKETGYVRTALGRRLRFHRGSGAHKAAGLLYQAYAADLHKIGLIAIDDAIRENRMDARLMLSVHDEAGVSKNPDPIEDAILQAAYTNFNSPTSRIQMRVPITSSANYGANWYEASKD